MKPIKVHYRPDDYPYWTLWKEVSGKLEMIGRPGDIDAGGIPTARPGFAPRLPLGKPSNACDPITGRRLRRGYDFQIKFSGSGHVMLDRFRLHAQRQTESSTAKV